MVHLCPAVPTHEKTAALTAISKSASSATVVEKGKAVTNTLAALRRLREELTILR